LFIMCPVAHFKHNCAGYGLFQGLGALGLLTQHLTVAENVIVQTTAVATATMPLAAGALLLLLPAVANGLDDTGTAWEKQLSLELAGAACTHQLQQSPCRWPQVRCCCCFRL
jgi:hypothetical protein